MHIKMSKRAIRAVVVVALLGVVALAYFTPLGGAFSANAMRLSKWADEVYAGMQTCIGERGEAECLTARDFDGVLAFDGGGEVCPAATYVPGGPHLVDIKVAPPGCYIGAQNGNFCVVTKGKSDATHCIDNSGVDARNRFCLVTGRCTE